MHVIIIADEQLKQEWPSQGQHEECTITWLKDVYALPASCDVLVDLLFILDDDRLNALKQVHANLKIINSVEHTLEETDKDFVRINGWNTFLASPIIEASANSEKNKEASEILFSFFNKTVAWVPDVPGFITARVISMIINEAFIALEEKVSSREDIDTAMKLGTNYPYGPFEWGEKIGIQNVFNLLNKLAKGESRFTPASNLSKGL
ncbi:MAG: 3-hydroxyacyl-CoA dehydrogenase family protein [Flavisolibacter sp.]